MAKYITAFHRSALSAMPFTCSVTQSTVFRTSGSFSASLSGTTFLENVRLLIYAIFSAATAPIAEYIASLSQPAMPSPASIMNCFL